MKCIFCNSELEISPLGGSYIGYCNECGVGHFILGDKIFWASKQQYFDSKKYTAVYSCDADETILYMNGSYVLSVKGKKDLNSFLSKVKMIEVFS